MTAPDRPRPIPTHEELRDLLASCVARVRRSFLQDDEAPVLNGEALDPLLARELAGFLGEYPPHDVLEAAQRLEATCRANRAAGRMNALSAEPS